MHVRVTGASTAGLAMNLDTVACLSLTLLLLFLQHWKTCRGHERTKSRRWAVADEPGQRYAFEDVALDDNGALSLVLSEFTDDLLHDLQDDPSGVDRLSESQARLLRDKLRGLYAHLKEHPALMERRLYVGSQKPNVTPREKHLRSLVEDLERVQLSKRGQRPPHPRPAAQTTSQRQIDVPQKRDFTVDIARPVCPSIAEWVRLYRARDMNNTIVEVDQTQPRKQWFYTVTCRNNAMLSQRACSNCCIGIDHERYSSSCRSKKSYVMAYVRQSRDANFDWDWIQVETACNCAITEASLAGYF